MQRITVGARTKNLQLRNGRWGYLKIGERVVLANSAGKGTALGIGPFWMINVAGSSLLVFNFRFVWVDELSNFEHIW